MLDPATKLAENTIYFDPNYTISGSTHYSPRERKASQNYASHESGESTPPLWRMSPQRSPPRRQNNYRSLSPESKARAVERGQRELMDMVRTMPEGCFELSLRDLVEKPWARPADHHPSQNHSHLNPVEHLVPKEESVIKMRSESSGNGEIVGSESTKSNIGRGGFLAFPAPVNSNSRNSSDVLPKTCGNRNEDKDWWKRKIPILEDSESATSRIITSTSKTSITRHGRRSILPSFCSFIRPKKSEHPHQKNRLQEL